MPTGRFTAGSGGGYGEDEYGDSGYGGTSTVEHGSEPPSQDAGSGRSPLGCRGAAHVTIHFEESGMALRPLSFDARQTYKRDDYFRAKLHREAAKVAADGIEHLEPVTVKVDGIDFYRGFVQSDSATVGHDKGQLEVYDPLKVLEHGYVDKEWQKVNLDRIATYIYEQRIDPYNVLPGVRFTGGENETRFQHDNLPTRGEWYLGFGDWLREVSPFSQGDGNFDFRGETPREAIQEMAEVFNVMVFTDTNQNLTLGFPDKLATFREAGRNPEAWRISDFNVPARQVPFGKIIVKGVTPAFGESEQGSGSSLLDYGNLPTHFENRISGDANYAYAKMKGYDGETTLMEYTKSNDTTTLKSVARGMMVKKYQENNSGTVTIDVMASENGLGDLTDVKVGDYLTTIENPDCNIRGDTFRINGIRHQWGPDVGWKMHLDVVSIVPNGSIETGVRKVENGSAEGDGMFGLDDLFGLE